MRPWGGLRGSPCGDADLQARLAFYNVVDSRFRAPVFVTAEELADCRECPMCSGCLTHNDCLTDLEHIEWFAQFAAPGEPTCDDEGTVAGRKFTCDLPPRHGRELHMCKRGYQWGRSRAHSRQGLN